MSPADDCKPGNRLFCRTRRARSRGLRSTPEAASALKAKGLSSSQVFAVNITDGVLTLFAKTVLEGITIAGRMYASAYSGPRLFMSGSFV